MRISALFFICFHSSATLCWTFSLRETPLLWRYEPFQRRLCLPLSQDASWPPALRPQLRPSALSPGILSHLCFPRLSEHLVGLQKERKMEGSSWKWPSTTFSLNPLFLRWKDWVSKGPHDFLRLPKLAGGNIRPRNPGCRLSPGLSGQHQMYVSPGFTQGDRPGLGGVAKCVKDSCEAGGF